MSAPDLTDTQEVEVAYTFEHIDAELKLWSRLHSEAKERGDITALNEAIRQLDRWLDRLNAFKGR